MSTKTINLLPHEASALAAGKLGVLIRVVEPQPRKGHIPTEDMGQWWPLYPTSAGMMQWVADGAFICPFGQPGTALECREALIRSDDGWWGQYEADGVRVTSQPPFVPLSICWWSRRDRCLAPSQETLRVEASDCPDFAIRFRPVVGEVRCVRAGDLTIADCIKSGLIDHADPLADIEPIETLQKRVGEKFDSIYGPGSWEADSWLWLATINREGE